MAGPGQPGELLLNVREMGGDHGWISCHGRTRMHQKSVCEYSAHGRALGVTLCSPCHFTDKEIEIQNVTKDTQFMVVTGIQASLFSFHGSYFLKGCRGARIGLFKLFPAVIIIRTEGLASARRVLAICQV